MIHSFTDALNHYNKLASTSQVKLDVRNSAVKEADKNSYLLEPTLQANKNALRTRSIQ